MQKCNFNRKNAFTGKAVKAKFPQALQTIPWLFSLFQGLKKAPRLSRFFQRMDTMYMLLKQVIKDKDAKRVN